VEAEKLVMLLLAARQQIGWLGQWEQHTHFAAGRCNSEEVHMLGADCIPGVELHRVGAHCTGWGVADSGRTGEELPKVHLQQTLIFVRATHAVA
jgi:hypothetical protein